MQEFEGKVVIVTGASRGIGREIAFEFARRGANVACIATTEKNAQATVDALAAEGFTQARAFGLDVSNNTEVDAVFSTIEKEMGTPFVLVNNAGITKDGLIMRMSQDDWERVISVNLRGTFNCCKAVTKPMMKARTGRIINISSVVGTHGAAGQVNYAATKAGVIGMTMSLAKELGSRGITVNAVAPGFIETDMTHELSEEMRDGVVKITPLGRLGSAKDIALPVVFLAGAGGEYITGQTLIVDGGMTL